MSVVIILRLKFEHVWRENSAVNVLPPPPVENVFSSIIDALCVLLVPDSSCCWAVLAVRSVTKATQAVQKYHCVYDTVKLSHCVNTLGSSCFYFAMSEEVVLQTEMISPSNRTHFISRHDDDRTHFANEWCHCLICRINKHAVAICTESQLDAAEEELRRLRDKKRQNHPDVSYCFFIP